MVLFIDVSWALCLPVLGILVFFVLASSVKIIRPIEKGVVERFGKFNRVAEPGLLIVVPFVEHSIVVPTTENRVDVAKQTVITKDNLNTDVDAIVYYRIQDVMKAIYNIDNYRTAIPSLAQTTLRAVMGKLTLSEANENRQRINQELESELDKETTQWGIDIIRVELQSIQPPHDVQQAMNNVVKAENEKIAAINLATAFETKADGEKRASIKMAEGAAAATELQAKANARSVELAAFANAKSIELRAEAEAKAIQLVNESAQKFFKGEAQTLKKLQVAQEALSHNTKYIIPEGTDISMVVSDASGTVVPVEKKKKEI